MKKSDMKDFRLTNQPEAAIFDNISIEPIDIEKIDLSSEGPADV